MEFKKRLRRKRPALFKSGQWHFQKVAVTKVIDTLTHEDVHGAFQKVVCNGYNKCIAARGDYFEGDKSFMCVLWLPKK